MVFISPQVLIFSFAIVVLSLASYFDIKKREVPDTLSYIFILGSVFLISILALYNNSISVLEFAPVSIGLFFGFSYLMYRLGQWGGGDVKIMLGLGILFTSFSLGSNMSFINLFINILFFGGLYGLLSTLAYGMIKIRALSKHLMIYDLFLVIGGAAAIVAVYFLFSFPVNLLLDIIIFLMVSMRYIYLIMDYLMYVEVPVDKLVEGDWLAEDVKKGNEIVVKKKNIGLENSDIETLKKEKVEKVIVKIGIPFMPAFLVGVIVTVFFVNPIFSLFIYRI